MDYSSQTHPLSDHLLLLALLAVWTREYVPETQRLVASPRYNRAPVGVHCEVENSMRVADQRSHPLQLRVAPNIDLVLRIPVCAHNLVHILTKCQVADLRSGIFFTQNLVG